MSRELIHTTEGAPSTEGAAANQRPETTLAASAAAANPHAPLVGTAALVHRLGLLGVGAALIWLAGVAYAVGLPATHHAAIAAIFFDYGAGFYALALAALAHPSRWKTEQRVAALLLGTAVTGTFWATISAVPGYGADTLALSHVAAEMSLAGRNPYQAVIQPEELERRFRLPESAITQLQQGGHISTLVSYPALHHLAFMPALALGVQDLRWVVLLFELACAAYLWRIAPPPLKLLSLAPLLVSPELTLTYSAGALTDWLWILPLMLTARALHDGATARAAAAYGLACAVKQQPWFAAPFLLVWVWRTGGPARRQRARSALGFVAVSTLVFLSANALYLGWDIQAWAGAVLVPLTQPLIPHGSGLSLLTQVGLVAMPKEFYLLASVAVAATALVAYTLAFDRVRPAAWVLAMVVLWFSYRSFHNYFVTWLPVLAVSVLLEYRAGSGKWRE